MDIETTKPKEGANDAAIRKEIRNFTPDIPAIRSAIEMLPSGHRLTLASISQLFHQVCNDSTNNTQPSHIAKCLSHEVCLYALRLATCGRDSMRLLTQILVEKRVL